ncbi:carbohydrate esterase family 4 protein [Suillus subalutaceus]|uniref:carbohydrate esterase family 4 protein n=1 Tax=Suillus subalutaceus TaxID=48586 RepID=UPI001B86D901|nr:carbohydrate esterase family 4 protein [Suillus subalutaceus]KAG1876447.1 carbohydrate esterase family 4 protein [Suillus subalutaceus]
MQLQALVTLLSLLGAANAIPDQHVRLAKRQNAGAVVASGSSSSSSGAPTTSFTSATSTSNSPVPTTPVGTTIPPLINITSGMATPSTVPLSATYSAGATPLISGAPVLPTPCKFSYRFVFQAASWPVQDQIAPTNSSEVSEWMEELANFTIPDLTPTVDGTCANDPSAAAQAASRGWWTCGGYTRVTDITACPDKLTWGVSFDDGPGFYSMELLDYLASKNLTSTFFVIGSRIVERPQVLVEEYMAGHEIAVHTWSHRPLTMLTTEQVVAELGWARKAVKDVIGVTPTLMRPPYGDIDDRVRAISLAMGMVPVIWTSTGTGATFDTNDWKVPGGVVTGPQSFATFEAILTNATMLNTGFVVLEHDLYAQTVDLAIGYTLPAAMNFTPALTFDSIGHCNGIPSTNLYRESNTNTSFPYPNSTSGDSTVPSSAGGQGNTTKTSGALSDAMMPISMVVTSLLAAGGSFLM